jgi:hypothetical protein
MSVLYFFMAVLILRRDTKRLNLTFVGFYSLVGIAGTINFVYALLPQPSLVYILHFITYYLYCYAIVFLLLFVLILIKSEKTISLKIELIIMAIFAILLFAMWFIPGGITIDATTGWRPDWSWEFTIYAMAVCSGAIVPIIYYSIQTYRKFDNPQLKKKWLFFILGCCEFFYLYYGTTISNALAILEFRMLWAYISLISVPGLIFIYFGVGKQLK